MDLAEREIIKLTGKDMKNRAVQNRIKSFIFNNYNVHTSLIYTIVNHLLKQEIW